MCLLNRIGLEQQVGQHAEAAISLQTAEGIREWLPPETLAMLTRSLDRLAALRQAQPRPCTEWQSGARGP
jgi:hypothetical protein